ncbi:MAG: hypothetical protein KKF00_12305 [Proteobacteria bacterium]|nr:hypothetical protein [Pseudomonadota bacterium]MBU1397405.1 hypothetical protein [Pseudomonadota bacterium]
MILTGEQKLCTLCTNVPKSFLRSIKSEGKTKGVREIQTLDQPLTVESKPGKKIGFTVKEKQARYGKQGNRQNEGNA